MKATKLMKRASKQAFDNKYTPDDLRSSIENSFREICTFDKRTKEITKPNGRLIKAEKDATERCAEPALYTINGEKYLLCKAHAPQS